MFKFCYYAIGVLLLVACGTQDEIAPYSGIQVEAIELRRADTSKPPYEDTPRLYVVLENKGSMFGSVNMLELNGQKSGYADMTTYWRVDFMIGIGAGESYEFLVKDKWVGNWGDWATDCGGTFGSTMHVRCATEAMLAWHFHGGGFLWLVCRDGGGPPGMMYEIHYEFEAADIKINLMPQ